MNQPEWAKPSQAFLSAIDSIQLISPRRTYISPALWAAHASHLRDPLLLSPPHYFTPKKKHNRMEPVPN